MNKSKRWTQQFLPLFLGRWSWYLLPAWGIGLLLANFQVTLTLLLGGLADLALILILLIVASGGATGFVLGRAQQKTLRRELDWEIEGWVRWSAIAGALSGALLPLPTLLTGQLLNREFLALALPLFFLILGTAQALLLHSQTTSAWLWPVANVSAAVIWSALMLRNPLYLYEPDYTPRLIAGLVMSFLAYALICGVVLFWLHEQRQPSDLGA